MEFENTTEGMISAVKCCPKVQEGEKGRMTIGLGTVEAFMTLRTAILWNYGHIKCVQHAVRGVQVKTGEHRQLPKFYCKGKNDSFYSDGRSRKYCFNWGGAKTAYVDNNGKHRVKLKKKRNDVTARDREWQMQVRIIEDFQKLLFQKICFCFVYFKVLFLSIQTFKIVISP